MDYTESHISMTHQLPVQKDPGIDREVGLGQGLSMVAWRQYVRLWGQGY